MDRARNATPGGEQSPPDFDVISTHSVEVTVDGFEQAAVKIEAYAQAPSDAPRLTVEISGRGVDDEAVLVLERPGILLAVQEALRLAIAEARRIGILAPTLDAESERSFAAGAPSSAAPRPRSLGREACHLR